MLSIIKKLFSKSPGGKARVYISGPGVFHVKSSEVLRSDEGKRQLEALKEIKIALNESSINKNDCTS